MKIVITDAVTVTNGDLDLTVLEEFGELTVRQLTPKEEVCDAIKDCDILLCNKTRIGREEMEAAPKLKYIGLFATGYNNIDTEEARKRGITVCNAGTYSSEAVSQQVFAFILAHYSKVSKFSDYVREGGWINSKTFCGMVYPTYELCGKTIGIIGYGAIGKTVARIANAFGMKVLVYTRTQKQDGTVEFTDLNTLLANSDIVTVHCPLNPQSAGMFDLAAFKKMKNTALFINTPRGGTVVEQDLRYALDNGIIARERAFVKKR